MLWSQLTFVRSFAEKMIIGSFEYLGKFFLLALIGLLCFSYYTERHFDMHSIHTAMPGENYEMAAVFS